MKVIRKLCLTEVRVLSRMSKSPAETMSVGNISLTKALEICEWIAPPLDEEEKLSLVFELPRPSFFRSYCEMYENFISFALRRGDTDLGVMGAFWELKILPGPGHFIYTVIEPKATASTSLLITMVKKQILNQGFSLGRVFFSFYSRLHDEKIYKSFKSQGLNPGQRDYRMKLDLPCEFQPRILDEDYSVEEVTEDTIYELIAITFALTQSKPFPQAYQEVVSDPGFTTRPYDPAVTRGFLARHGREPIASLATVFIGEIAYIMNMIVSPSHRRRGVAQNMLKEASSIAFQKGCRAILLSTRVENNEAAVNLYRKLGFREVGIREGFHFRE